MNPQETMYSHNNQQAAINFRAACPATSPWTETFAASGNQDSQSFEMQSDESQQTFNSETVKPTRDALYDIYNRGY